MLREDFHYMMDTELWHRYVSRGKKLQRIPKYTWGLRIHEDAKMSGHYFENSKLSDKNHPSWVQKKKEIDFIQSNYPINKYFFPIWQLFKTMHLSFYTRFLDKRFLGKKYTQI